jgi:tyrosyl-tRNA synthetase
VAQFSKRTFGAVQDLPVVMDLAASVTDTVKSLGFAKSNSEVRRLAEQNGLRLVVETDETQEQMTVDFEEARNSLAAIVKEKAGDRRGAVYLKVGRRIARVEVADGEATH